MKLLTNLIFEPKGKHDPALAYTIKDTVMSADGSQVYFALQDVPAGTALDNEDYWKLQIDLHDTLVEMQEAAAAAAGAVSANVDQNLTETQKATARRNIGMDKVIESLSDPLEASGNPLVVKPVGGMPFESVVTEFSPKQAGSGDPYPAGGGRNLLDLNSWERMSCVVDGDKITSNINNGYYIALWSTDVSYIQNGTVLTFSVKENNTGRNIQIVIYGEREDGASAQTANSTGKSVTATVSGFTRINEIDIRLNVAGAPFTDTKSVFEELQLEIGSTATSYTPYENIRPISGWDKLNLNAAGKNLFDQSLFTENEFEQVGYFFRSVKPLFPAGTYTWTKKKFESTIANINVSLQGEKENVDVIRLLNYDTKTFTCTEPLYLAVNYKNTTFAERSIIEGQLEFASTSTPYAPYQGNVLRTLQIGQTVYGGRFDWLTGKLVVEWGLYEFDGTEMFSMDSGGIWTGTSGNSFYCNVPFNSIKNSAPVSNMFKGIRRNDTALFADNTVCVVGGNGEQVEFIRTNHSTVDGFKAFLAAQKAANMPVQVSGMLATPTTIQLPATEIIALPGTNTLYGDGDTITVTGREPKTNALESRLAALEAAMTNV